MKKLLRNMSIKQKLILGFMSMAILLIAVGIMGKLSMENVAGRSKIVLTTNVKDIQELHLIKEELLNIQGEVQKAVLYGDNEKTKEAVTKIEGYLNQIREYLNSYKGRLDNDEENQAWERLQANIDENREICYTLINLANDGKYADAEKLLDNATENIEVMFNGINEMIQSNDDILAQEIVRNEKFTASSAIFMNIVIIIGLAISVFVGILISVNISRAVKKGILFAEALGKGDLTTEVTIENRDEIGKLLEALTQAQANMKEIIYGIALQTSEVSSSSEELSATIEEISSTFETISSSTTTIFEGVLDIKAATEELTATIEDVNSGVSQLAANSTDGSGKAIQIKERASKIKENGNESKLLAERLYEEKQAKILEAIEKGKVVDDITKVAALINGIATQTNLLALNASIEAARAGEHGRGFSVVATEIGSMATQSARYVNDITETVASVQNAFLYLSENAKDLLEFIDKRVLTDYEQLVDTGNNYENDSIYISELSEDTAAMSEELSAATEEISSVIHTISGNMDDSSVSLENIKKNMNETSIAMDQIAKAAEDQALVAETLSTLVAKFKI